MTTPVAIAPSPVLQFFDNRGVPAAGGTVLTQVASVNYPTYQDSAGATPLPNPIPLNSRGEVSNSSGVSCQLFLVIGSVYTFTLYDSAGNQLNQATYVAGGGLSTSLAASTGSSLVGFIQAGTGAVATTLQANSRERVSLTQFAANGVSGARCDPGVADNGPGVQAAIIYCAANNKTLFVPALFPMTTAVTSTVMCDIECDTANDGFTWNGSSAGFPFTFNLSAAVNFLKWQKVGIFAGSTGNGVNGVRIVIAGASGQLANFNINVNIEGFSGPGMLLDNSLNSSSSIFQGHITGYCANGIKGLLVGDSIDIDYINLPSVSPTVGNTEIGVNLTFYSGAKGLHIGANANITTGGGAVALTNAIAPVIDAECEYLGTYTYVPASMNGGLIYFHNCQDGVVRGSLETSKGTSAHLTPTYAVVFDGATCLGNVIESCRLNYGESTNHVFCSTGAYGNVNGAGNTYMGSSNQPKWVIHDAGGNSNPQAAPQIGIPLNLTDAAGTSLMTNSWVLDGTNGDTQITLLLGIDGMAELFGQVKSGIAAGIMTMPPPVVCIPSTVTIATCGVSNAGVTIDTETTVLVMTSGAGAALSLQRSVDTAHAMISGFRFPYYLTRTV